MTNEKKVAEWIREAFKSNNFPRIIHFNSYAWIEINRKRGNDFGEELPSVTKFITDAINEKIARVKNE